MTDFGIAKPVDRLHRIADTEKGAAVTFLPTGHELFQKVILGNGRVLHFVDQQMTDLIVEQERHFPGVICAA